MIDLNDYIYFPEGSIELGIDISDIEKVSSNLINGNIKKEHITASTPRKKKLYNEFHIKKKLISVKNFSRFITETSYITESEKEGWGWIWSNSKWVKEKNVSWRKPFLENNDNYSMIYSEDFPVMQVTWNDAVEYSRWLSGKSGYTIRLPFEHEWEILGNYAGLHSVRTVILEKKEKLHSDIDFIKTLSKQLSNSAFQLGLLWEWTLDWYDAYDISSVNKDFGRIYKTLRGGSLLSENIQKTKEFRFRRCPTARSPYYGFRTVIDSHL